MTSTYHINLRSDACFGASHNDLLHDVDTCTALDDLGLPYVSARIVRGLLDEAVARLVQVSGDHPRVVDAAGQALGVPGALTRASLELGNAYHPSRAIAAVLDEGRGPEALRLVARCHTEVRQQTKIETATGSAEAGSLRSTRVIPRETVLAGSVTWQDGPLDAAPADVRALVCLGFASIRRAGLHRTRGWGHVRCGLDVDAATLRAWSAPLRTLLEEAA